MLYGVDNVSMPTYTSSVTSDAKVSKAVYSPPDTLLLGRKIKPNFKTRRRQTRTTKELEQEEWTTADFDVRGIASQGLC